MKKVSIIIPAYNEEKRISQTLASYISFFKHEEKNNKLAFEIVVVLNGCVDSTLDVVSHVQKELGYIQIVDLTEAGKGLAIRAGFAEALKRNNDFIGFVDADMATEPEYFNDLIKRIHGADGAIASRYMPGAQVFPPRPWIKRWGSKLIYESLITLLFGLRNYDYQCGAKLFKRCVIEMITPQMVMDKWAFDVEILYLCKKFGFSILEIPTVWHDKAGSKLRISSGFRMLGSLFKLRLRHSWIAKIRL
jgi:dolichyl-phosphate beta-glucosyltransferase